MAFENGNGMGPADLVALLRGNGAGGWGNDGAGGWWIILFFLLLLGGGWGNGGFMGGNRASTPYIAADMQRGFDQQSLTSAISGLSDRMGSGFADAAVARCSGDAAITQAVTGGNAALTQAITSGNASLTQAVTGGQAALTQAVTSGQYATAQAITGAKDTIAGGMNQLAMSLQNCCCENRAGLADLKYTVATENCQDRQALSDGLRDLMAQNTANTNAIVQSQNQGFQNVLDKLCQMELDNLKSENANLRTQLNMAGLAASQTAQTAQLMANANQQTQAIINSCRPTPVPAYTVPNPCGCGYGYGACG